MPTIPEFLRVNDTPFAWQDCEFEVALQRYQELIALDYSDKRDRKKVKAMKRDGTPMGVTTGSYECDALSFSMLFGAYQNKFIPQLGRLAAAQGKPGSYGDAIFPMQLKVSQSGIGAEAVVITFNKCWVAGAKDGWAEGIDEAIVQVTFGCHTLDRGGDGKLWSVVQGIL